MKNKLTLMLLMPFLSLAVIACSANTVNLNNAELEESTKTFYYFDSQIDIRFFAYPDANLDEIHVAIDNLLERVHCVSTRYEEPLNDDGEPLIDCDGYTQIKTLNNNPGETFEVDPIIVDMIDMSVHYYNDERTGGKYNIALGKVINVWSEYTDMCRNEQHCVVPEIDKLEAAAQNINPNNIVYNLEDNTVMVPEGMELNLGGIAKGYGAKLVGDLLREEFDNLLDAWIVNAGTSNIEFYGDHPSAERNYWIGVLRDPFNPYFNHYARVKLHSGQNLVTSGDYERFYVVDDVNYHHLIDPDTLFPANHTRGVTVISENPALGDKYSTVAFVLPLDEAMAFIDSLENVEGIWIDEHREVHMTSGFEENHLYEPINMSPDEPVDAGQTTVVIVLVSILGIIFIAFLFVVLRERKNTDTSTNEQE